MPCQILSIGRRGCKPRFHPVGMAGWFGWSEERTHARTCLQSIQCLSHFPRYHSWNTRVLQYDGKVPRYKFISSRNPSHLFPRHAAAIIRRHWERTTCHHPTIFVSLQWLQNYPICCESSATLILQPLSKRDPSFHKKTEVSASFSPVENNDNRSRKSSDLQSHATFPGFEVNI